MIAQPDLIARDVLREAFAQTRLNPHVVIDDVFSDRPPDEREEFSRYFMDATPEVLLGYARETSTLPAVFVVVGDAGEVVQPLGLLIENDESQDLVVERQGVAFQSTTIIMCVAPNATAAIALQAVSAYALLGARSRTTKLGLYEQTLGISDFQPVEVYLPDNVFRRDIRLRARYFATFSTSFPKLREITVTATSSDEPLSRVTVSSPR